MDIPLTEAKIAINPCPLKIIHKTIISLAIRIPWKTQFREVDETGLDETGLDETGLDETSSRRNRYQSLVRNQVVNFIIATHPTYTFTRYII